MDASSAGPEESMERVVPASGTTSDDLTRPLLSPSTLEITAPMPQPLPKVKTPHSSGETSEAHGGDVQGSVLPPTSPVAADPLWAEMRRDGGLRQSHRPRRSKPRVWADDEESVKHREYEPHKPTGALATFALAYGSIGVVFGDLGTSCLYTIAGIFASFNNNKTVVKDDILGAISLIFWTLTLIAVVKYILVVLNADDNGEGGTFALYSLLCRNAHVGLLGQPAASGNMIRHLDEYDTSTRPLIRPQSMRTTTRNILERSKPLRRALLVVVLLATSMVLGDGVLTPAISVLSAVQGVQVRVPSMSDNTVLGITCVILAILFLLQRFGTAKIGFVFSPITIMWLVSCASIGAYNIWKHHDWDAKGFAALGIFRAVSPHYIISFFRRNGREGFYSLCGVILCVTGTEALFADIGHYSRTAIQFAFIGFIYPCLILTYFGQGAFLYEHPEAVSDAFWATTPAPVFWFMVVLATFASVVASQALISGAFSLVKQSMSLSCFPRVGVIHTSHEVAGQIYIPEINYLIMVLTISVVLIFRDSTKLGNAYGLAVASVMLLTTMLMSLVMLLVWAKGIFLTLLFLTVFGTIELAFLVACLPMLLEGAWFPIFLAVVFLSVMFAWHYGSAAKIAYDMAHKVRLSQVTEFANTHAVARIPGIGLYYSETTSGVPAVLAHFLTNLRALSQILVFITIRHVPVPEVKKEDRLEIQKTAMMGVYRCISYYGYQEEVHHDGKFVEELVKRIQEHVQSHGAHLARRPRRAGEPMTEETLNALKTVEDEVRKVNDALKEGVIYVMGRADLIPAPGASMFRRTMLEAHRLLRAFSYSPDRVCHIPHDHLLEVGMLYDIGRGAKKKST